MAGHSPPKPPGQRRRRNAGQNQWRELPAEGRRGSSPALPGEDWLDSTIAWWKTIWASPMATIWEDADLDGLHRLAQLRDAQHRGDLPVSALGAMQALEDHYGLNPKARRMLQWEIKQSEVVDMHQRGPAQRKLRAVEEAN
jgi:hypothetical protein